MGILHRKISLLSNNGDPNLVQPSDWNDEHIIQGALDLSAANPVSVQDLIVNGRFGLLPNTVLPFSATPVFNVSTNHSYSMVLTGNVTSSTTTGTPLNGSLLSLTLTEDAIGGWTFAFPANFVFPPAFTFSTTGTAINELTFKFDGTNWHLISNSGTGGGGGSPANPNNSIQKNNGGAFGASSISDTGTAVTVGNPTTFSAAATVTGAFTGNSTGLISGNFTVGGESQFHGPNPYFDVRAFGVRAVSSTPSTTGTINSGSPTLTVASGTGFVNGDGIVVRGAGTANGLSTPSAPTVTPSNAQVMTGTGLVVTNTTGATTYQYQIVARTTAGGYTPASGVTSIANGPATLGSNSVNISSWTASGQTVTVNTSTPHNLVIGSMVLIIGAGNANGFWAVATVPTGSSFTFQTLDDTALGADPSGGAAGTVQWWNCNHITWTEVPNAYEYFIYGRTAGAMNLIGISLPQSSSFGGAITGDPTAAAWDDFGSTMDANISSSNVPDWVPLTPPVSAKNNDLVTTIVSGAGTTTFTLAANASNSVVGATTKFDNAPNISAAALASTNNKTGQNGVLYFPAQPTNNFYITNSVMSLGQFPTTLLVMMSGQLALGDTMILGATQWSGRWPGQGQSQSTFQLWKLPQIVTATAFPLIYSSKSSVKLDHVTLTHTSPQGIIWVNDELGAIPGLELDHVNFSTSGNDYMSMHLLVRGDQNSGANIKLTNIGGNGGGLPNNLGVTATPYYFFWGCGDPAIFESWSIARRGFFLGAVNGPGFGAPVFSNIYIQGSVMPIVTGYINGGVLQMGASFGVVTNDTGNMPTLSVFGQPALRTSIGPNGSVSQPTLSATTGGTQSVRVGGSTDGAGGFFNSRNTVVDSALGTAIDGFFSTNGTPNYLETYRNASIAFGNPYQAFVLGGPLPTPTCSVSAGGTVGLGTYTFQIVAFYPNGGSSMLSPASSSCTTTSGNQTVTINWATVPGATGYGLYENGIAFSCGGAWTSPGTNNSYVWGGVAPCNGPRPSIPGSGIVGFNGTGLWAPTFKVVSTDLGGTATVRSTTLTANRTHNLPDVSGAFALSPTIANNTAGLFVPGHVPVGDAHTAGTIIDSGVQQMAVFDDMHHANGTIQASNPNWSASAGTINISSNAAQGGGGQSFAIYSGVSWPSNDQSATITLGSSGSPGNNARVGVRLAAAAQTGYLCSYASTTTTLNTTKVVAGAFTTLEAITLPAVLGANDTIGITVVGTTIRCSVNGKPVGSPQTDAAISTGTPGISFFGSGANTIVSFAASYGSVSLGFAQTWTGVQTFAAAPVFSAGISGTGTIGTLTAPLDKISAAGASNSINNGDNAQSWNWALTTAAKTAFTFTENTAAINGAGSQFLSRFVTLAGSTAVPLNVTNSLTGAQILPTLSITPTWNTSGVVDAALLVNPTNTASGTGSLLIDAQLANTSQWKVDKAGNVTQVGTLSAGASAPACTAGSAGGACLNEGTAPSSGANFDTLYAASADHMLHQNLNNAGDLPVPNRQMLTSTYTNATTTASNITGLAFTAAANSNYAWQCHLYYQGSAGTAGLDITITGPASPTSVFYSYDELPTATSIQDSVANAFSTKLTGNATITATTNFHAIVTMGLRNGANAGTVQLQGSATGTGTVTVQAGSHCVVY